MLTKKLPLTHDSEATKYSGACHTKYNNSNTMPYHTANLTLMSILKWFLIHLATTTEKGPYYKNGGYYVPMHLYKHILLGTTACHSSMVQTTSFTAVCIFLFLQCTKFNFNTDTTPWYKDQNLLWSTDTEWT